MNSHDWLLVNGMKYLRLFLGVNRMCVLKDRNISAVRFAEELAQQGAEKPPARIHSTKLRLTSS
jgi:hypothetical protein